MARSRKSTSGLRALAIEVEVLDGVAHLRGVVAGLEDAEVAEAVTARVPGVIEVADELELRSPGPPREGADAG
jgi:osmotically-inducible protein OsmY